MKFLVFILILNNILFIVYSRPLEQDKLAAPFVPHKVLKTLSANPLNKSHDAEYLNSINPEEVKTLLKLMKEGLADLQDSNEVHSDRKRLKITLTKKTKNKKKIQDKSGKPSEFDFGVDNINLFNKDSAHVLVSANTTSIVETTTEVTNVTTIVSELKNMTNEVNVTSNRRSDQIFNDLSIPQPIIPIENLLQVPKTYGKCQDTDVILKIWSIISDILEQEQKYNTLLSELDQIQNVLSLVNNHLVKAPLPYQNPALQDQVKNLQNQLNNKEVMLTRFSQGGSPTLSSLLLDNRKPPSCRGVIIKLFQSVQKAYTDLINNPLCNGNNNGKLTSTNEFSIDNYVLIPNSRDIVTTELPHNFNLQDVIKILPASETSKNMYHPGDTVSALPYQNQFIQQPVNFHGYSSQYPEIDQGVRFEKFITNNNQYPGYSQQPIEGHYDQNANIPSGYPTMTNNDESLTVNEVANAYSNPHSHNKYSLNRNIYKMRYNKNPYGLPTSSVQNRFVGPQYQIPLMYGAKNVNSLLNTKLPVNSLINNYRPSENTGVNNYNYNPIIDNAVTNLNKLNNLPTKFQEIELTYLLKHPKPLVYQPFYYVKYRMAYNTFMNNLRQIVSKKPELRSNPHQLYQELISGSNVTDLSPDLNSYGKEQISKLVFNSGSLVGAKVIEDETELDDHLKEMKKSNELRLGDLKDSANKTLSYYEQLKNIDLRNINNLTEDKKVDILVAGQNNLIPTSEENLKLDGQSANVINTLRFPSNAIPNNLMRSPSNPTAFNSLLLQNHEISNVPNPFLNQAKPPLPINFEQIGISRPSLMNMQEVSQYPSGFNYYTNQNVPNILYNQQQRVAYPAQITVVDKGSGILYPLRNTEVVAK